jgi:hypothetical protein
MKPIAWYDPTNGMVSADKDSSSFTPLGQVWPLYPQSEPPRTWAGLTEAQCGVLWKVDMTPFDYYQAIEAKLKEKNT